MSIDRLATATGLLLATHTFCYNALNSLLSVHTTVILNRLAILTIFLKSFEFIRVLND